MNTRLIVLGLNMVILSFLLVVYGYLVNNSSLIGIGASTGIIGGVFLVYAYIPSEPSQEAFINYLNTVVNGITTVLEDLDLLNYKICVDNSRGGKTMLLVYTKADCPINPNPGIGQHLLMPYFSIPTEIFQEVNKLEEITSPSLEDRLNTLLVSSLGVCKSVRAEIRGDIIAVDVIGVTRALSNYLRYPVDPITVLTLALVTRLTDAELVKVVEREISMNNVRLRLKVEAIA